MIIKRKLSPKILLLLASLGLSLSSCASQQAPGGGPEDKTAPIIVYNDLKPGSVNIPIDQKITLFFSEVLDPISVQKAVSLYPLNQIELQIKVRRKRVTIQPRDRWADNQAYIIMIDRAVSDMHKNRLSEPLTLAFSTGDSIPEGQVNGRIRGLTEKDNPIITLSQSSNPDSLFITPVYKTQADDQSRFTFTYIPQKSFSLSGYLDKDNSNSYDPRFDDLLLPDQLHIIPKAQPDRIVTMTVVRGHFGQGKLLSANSIHPGHSKLTFSKYVADWTRLDSLRGENCSIDTVIINEDKLEIYHSLVSEDSVRIHVAAICDTLNIFFADTAISFPVTTLTDTGYSLSYLKPWLEIFPPADALIHIKIIADSDTAEYQLSESFAGHYFIPDSITAPSELIWTKTDTAHHEYRVNIPAKKISEYGWVIGSILAPPRTRLRLSGKQFSQETFPDKNGEYKFTAPPGSYSLGYYIDMNNNQRRDYGQVNPFLPPEIYISLAGNIAVRANWDTELENLTIED